MILALFCIFLVTAFFAIFEDKLSSFKWVIYALVCVCLVLLAGFRPVGIDNDSINYELYFFKYDNPLFENTVEPSFRFISGFLYKNFKDVHSIFIVYALFGVSLKLIAFRKLTQHTYLALSIYICTYYILHELTQIRIGISSGLLLLAIVEICNERRKNACGLFLIALLFHYSSIMLFPILFMSNKDFSFKEKYFWSGLVIAGYGFYFLHIGLATLPIPYIADKLQAYEELKQEGFIDEVNVFNIVFLVKIAIFYYIMYFYDIIKKQNNYLPFMIKMESISLFSFTALSTLPVLSFRVSELFGIVEIILYTNILYTIRPNLFGKIISLTIGFILMFIAIYYNKLIQI